MWLLLLVRDRKNKGSKEEGWWGQDFPTERSKLSAEALYGAPVGRSWRIWMNVPGDLSKGMSSSG